MSYLCLFAWEDVMCMVKLNIMCINYTKIELYGTSGIIMTVYITWYSDQCKCHCMLNTLFNYSHSNVDCSPNLRLHYCLA